MAIIAAALPSFAQDKKDTPRITAIAPIGVTAGTEAKLKIRGVKLDAATEIRFPAHPALKAEVRDKKKADLPNGAEAKDVGDTQCEATIALSADLPAGPLAIEVVTSNGTSEPREIAVVGASARMEEKEPNNGFAEAQPVELGKIARGQVKEDRDVDVFAVNATENHTLTIEVTAARRSSMLDPIISIYDEKRRLLRVVDDSETRDPVVTFRAPAAGKYFIVLQDANDRGGTWHNYELVVKETP